MDFREVRLNFGSEDVTKVAELAGYHPLQIAIGYLSTWNFTFPKVEISIVDKVNPELVAVYFTADGVRGYVIGAVWQEGYFSYHS